MKVKEIMKRDVKTVSPNATVKDASIMMNEHKIGSVLVVEDNKLLGIVTESDVMSKVAASDRNSSEVCVHEIMTPDVITISEDHDVEHAAKIMTMHNIKKLPVLSKGKRLVGIVTATDIVTSGVKLEEETLKKLAQFFPVAKHTITAG